MEGLQVLKDAVVGGISNILSFFATLLDYLNPYSNNFILKPIINLFNTLITYLNPFSENFILKPIIEFLTTLIDWLNPFSDNFILKIAFIPQSEEFELKKQELIDTFTQKFIFYDNIVDMFKQIKNLGSGSSAPPTFKITLPSKYGGGTYSIIDFSYFTDYRIYILNFQRCIMWFFFIKGIFRSLPKTTSLQG
ncbi:hypothetical protein [Sedimentibacter sp.]|uniref:hypothetical protein n=1 Tax=Sedimentibacter sp. TaxID=1960295 RepID=UPI00289BC108|nr:hypothetical protein [Sedimentibacter sp.]